MSTAGDTVYGTATLPGTRHEGASRTGELSAAAAVAADETGYSDFPCSVAQERFWLLDRLEPGNPAYNVAVRWRLEGEVSSELLESAWNEILARHEILRTRFLEVDGRRAVDGGGALEPAQPAGRDPTAAGRRRGRATGLGGSAVRTVPHGSFEALASGILRNDSR